MVQTIKCLEKALEICGQQDRDLDEEQEKLTQRRKRVKEQRDILELLRRGSLDEGINHNKSVARTFWHVPGPSS